MHTSSMNKKPEEDDVVVPLPPRCLTHCVTVAWMTTVVMELLTQEVLALRVTTRLHSTT